MENNNGWMWKLKNLQEDDDSMVATVIAVNPRGPFTTPAKQDNLPDSYGKLLVDSINAMNKRLIEENLESLEVAIVKMNNFYGNTLTIKLKRNSKVDF